MSPPATLPRLLAGASPAGPIDLTSHRRIHGLLPDTPGSAAPLLDEVERAGLRGHGGAGFPLARKMATVLRARGRAIVVANGTEGEPVSDKDRVLMTRAPHLVLDGVVAAARALGAGDAYLCIGEHAAGVERVLRQALAERSTGGAREPRIRLVGVPELFVAGQETALVSHIDGGAALPTFQQRRVAERGVRRRPTLVSNVETYAHVALIARHGAEWYRGVGTIEDPGSALVTVSGAVHRPGVYEIAHGTSLASLLVGAGRMTGPVRAALIGGYFGDWIPFAEFGRVRLSHEALGRLGASLGAGAIVILGDDACPVAEIARVARWQAAQGAQQCGPCVHGLAAIAGGLDQIRRGVAPPGTQDEIGRWGALASKRGACAHPDGAVRFVLSGLSAFAQEFAEHAAFGPCRACALPALLPTPSPYAAELVAA